MKKRGSKAGTTKEVRGFKSALEMAVRAVIFGVLVQSLLVEQMRRFERISEPNITIAARARKASGVNSTPRENLTGSRNVTKGCLIGGLIGIFYNVTDLVLK